MSEIACLSEIAPQFDAFFVDQFGVLLDGRKPYSGAPEALQALSDLGKPIILLSNSGKRGEANARRLVQLGFARNSFQEVLSSGEVAYAQLIMAMGDDLPQMPKIWLHARDNDLSAIEGLPVELVEKPETADLLLLAASNADSIELSDYVRLLKPAAQRKIPCWCTNPDMAMLTGQGVKPGAGRIAQEYKAMGGAVTFIGKPFPAIYQEAARRLELENPRILCIGDSVEHDIAGGASAGHQTCLVGTGVHAGVGYNEMTDQARKAGIMFDYYLPAFRF
ncbi:TIGR01459 family HAD-type hydrolase [Brucella sp. NBRC 12950]|uniref:TIGR01459 family HAD-type hydrolase n=1 Tax=Brucella sp. NBRC 12950 TaxID=2994518 RepID=UPI0024A4134C|nr:TIGR01459 family HAD-type hydrolase [Brucella sp. NBRC 12950]GLU25393.1 haloacid dehalogenase [Brucella sp. NBRC 12950]